MESEPCVSLGLFNHVIELVKRCLSVGAEFIGDDSLDVLFCRFVKVKFIFKGNLVVVELVVLNHRSYCGIKAIVCATQYLALV